MEIIWQGGCWSYYYSSLMIWCGLFAYRENDGGVSLYVLEDNFCNYSIAYKVLLGKQIRERNIAQLFTWYQLHHQFQFWKGAFESAPTKMSPDQTICLKVHKYSLANIIHKYIQCFTYEKKMVWIKIMTEI